MLKRFASFVFVSMALLLVACGSDEKGSEVPSSASAFVPPDDSKNNNIFEKFELSELSEHSWTGQQDERLTIAATYVLKEGANIDSVVIRLIRNKDSYTWRLDYDQGKSGSLIIDKRELSWNERCDGSYSICAYGYVADKVEASSCKEFTKDESFCASSSSAAPSSSSAPSKTFTLLCSNIELEVNQGIKLGTCGATGQGQADFWVINSEGRFNTKDKVFISNTFDGNSKSTIKVPSPSSTDAFPLNDKDWKGEIEWTDNYYYAITTNGKSSVWGSNHYLMLLEPFMSGSNSSGKIAKIWKVN